MAFTKVAAPAKTADSKIITARDARAMFTKSNIRFPDGCEFTLVSVEVVQFCKPGETTPSPTARRHIILKANNGDELMLSALWTPKQKLDIQDLSKAPETIQPNGTLTAWFDKLIDANPDKDIEELVVNSEELKKLKLRARRTKFYGIDYFGNKTWMTMLNIDIIE